MTRTRLYTSLSWTISVLLAGIFLYAALPKILHPDHFGQSIHRYQMLSNISVSLMAIYLPWLEFAAALFLIWPRYRVAASVLITAMLLLFVGALGSALARDLDISCGCFSHAGTEKNIGPGNVMRNVVLLSLAAALPFLHARSRRHGQASPM
ncbi:MAG: DoxX family protein [Verrucomicrobia bacterium]|nr:DoxX family protein [Verrucomicrobiota bacterium]